MIHRALMTAPRAASRGNLISFCKRRDECCCLTAQVGGREMELALPRLSGLGGNVTCWIKLGGWEFNAPALNQPRRLRVSHQTYLRSLLPSVKW